MDFCLYHSTNIIWSDLLLGRGLELRETEQPESQIERGFVEIIDNFPTFLFSLQRAFSGLGIQPRGHWIDVLGGRATEGVG